MKKVNYLILLLLLGMPGLAFAQRAIDLSGNWGIALDSLDRGITEQWYTKSFSDNIQLPGTTDGAGMGVSCQLAPRLEKPQLLHLTRKHSYIGAAWYNREITIPKEMANRPLNLFLERVMWKSRLWIDGKEVDMPQESLTAPHQFIITGGLSAGKHILTLCIDNRKQHDISVKDLAHAYTNDTQIMWNGVLGKMELVVVPKVNIRHVAVYPDIKNKRIKVIAKVENSGRKPVKAELELQVTQPENLFTLEKKQFPVILNEGTQTLEYDYPMGGDVKLWDEFSPELYTLFLTCRSGKETVSKEATFGMREIKGSRGVLSVNGNRVFLRGTLECCIFPLTGTPPMTEEGWTKVFSVAKEWGLNHLRFHSWCPPEAAFRVADKMGFYVQVELPLWSLNVGEDEKTNQFLYQEFDRIIREYGNHPSFCLMSIGNELQPDFNFLNVMVKYMKEQDNRHLYTTTTFTFEKGHGGHPEPEDEFFITQWTDNGWIRGQGIFDQEPPCFNKDYSAATQEVNVPLISHEIGQYAVYPNLKEIDKYTGVLDPLNFKAVKRDLQQKGLYDKADRFLEASGKLAVQLYKEEIERAMKTPSFSGFQLLDLHDFPGQGTALVGLLDAFWDSKGVTDASFFRQFCAPVVPLARFAKAVYSGDENFTASVEIANYSNRNMDDKKIIWKLKNKEGKSIAAGALSAPAMQKGQITRLGEVNTGLGEVKEASKLTFEVSIEGTEWKNNWSVWVYPPVGSYDTSGVVLTQSVDEAMAALNKGRKVLLSPKAGQLEGLEGKFLPVFWSPVHFPKQAGTMGLLSDPQHAALRHFPTDMHSDWQWWNLIKNSKVLVADSLPPIEPIVESVDNFANNRRLVSIFETNCGKGKLIVSAMDLLSDNDGKPEVKQLLYSLVSYMNSASFAPKSRLGEADIKSFILVDEAKDKQTDAISIYEE